MTKENNIHDQLITQNQSNASNQMQGFPLWGGGRVQNNSVVCVAKILPCNIH